MLHLPRIDAGKTGHSLRCLSMPEAVLTRPKICFLQRSHSIAEAREQAAPVTSRVAENSMPVTSHRLRGNAGCDAYVSATD